ncbi:MAG: alpha/beta hydrolase [Cytophagaceae bacterium]|nr:alpha/beta hydrolase [Gemmatimonadaceae bacterium]
MMLSRLALAPVLLALLAVPRRSAGAQGQGPRGPSPTVADVHYAPAVPRGTNGHKLDLYLPPGASAPTPVVLWTAGSAWMRDDGKRGAEVIAAQLIPLGYAVAGVSIRSSSQVQFPSQLHDIKAAIRWIRANAAMHNIDPARIGIIGTSSGGWATAMAAVTGDAPEMEGSVGVLTGSSAVQAAIAFFPPTDFLSMDAWALRRCPAPDAPRAAGEMPCHDDERSPESQLVGCAIQRCPEQARAADPVPYITAADAPLMILHGGSDPLVPHNQGERLYMALNKACANAVFISVPKAGHGPLGAFLSDDIVREGATIRSTAAQGCAVTNPALVQPTWKTVTDFLEKHLK